MTDRAARNQIFNDQNPELQDNYRNVSKQDFDWEVPVESAPLPSEGKIYPQNSPLFRKSSLNIRAMTAKEEDIINSRALIKSGKAVSTLIDSCLTDKSISADDMLAGDRNSLMVAIRVTGYGANYDVDIKCPNCSYKNNKQYNLGELQIKPLQLEPIEPGVNLFEFDLPVSKKKVVFKFLTVRDENEASVVAERKKKLLGDSGITTTVTDKLLSHIVSIDGIKDRAKIQMFIQKMPAFDSRKLRTFIAENEPDLDMNVDFECSSCGDKSKVELPLGINFFWPAL